MVLEFWTKSRSDIYPREDFHQFLEEFKQLTTILLMLCSTESFVISKDK